jgi:hypothetical protein
MSTVLVVRGWACPNRPTVRTILWLRLVLGFNKNMHVGARLRR